MKSSLTDRFCRSCLQLAFLLFLASLVAVLAVLPWLACALVIGIAWRLRGRAGLAGGTVYGRARWCSGDEAAAAGMFQPRGLFLGRFAGEPPNHLRAIARLFTLPPARSTEAVRQFFATCSRRG